MDLAPHGVSESCFSLLMSELDVAEERMFDLYPAALLVRRSQHLQYSPSNKVGCEPQCRFIKRENITVSRSCPKHFAIRMHFFVDSWHQA